MISVDIGIGNFELDNIGTILDISKKVNIGSLEKNKIQKKTNPARLKGHKTAGRRVEEVKLHCNTDEHLQLACLRKLIFYFRELQENPTTRAFAAAASKHPDQTATPSRNSGLAGNICVCARRYARRHPSVAYSNATVRT